MSLCVHKCTFYPPIFLLVSWQRSQKTDFDSSASRRLKVNPVRSLSSRSNRVVKQKEVRLCSGRSELLILRKKDKVSPFWFLLPTLCQQLHGQDQLDFLFKGGNSCTVLELLEIQPNPDTRHLTSVGCTLLTPHRAQVLMGHLQTTWKDEQFKRKMENIAENTLMGHDQSSQNMPKLDFLSGKTHEIHTRSCSIQSTELGQQVVSAGHECDTGQGSCSHRTAASCLGI